MKEEHKKILFVLLGIVLVVTRITAPIHEMGHILAATITGGSGYFLAWNQSQLDIFWGFRHFVYAMGEGFELMVLMGIYFATKKNTYVGYVLRTFCYLVPLHYVILSDFHDYPGSFVFLILIDYGVTRLSFGPILKVNSKKANQTKKRKSATMQ